ncbi:MAG TPA: hypothetical protein VEF34_11570 [Syntrophobacteraceae bacterium]|nr:hypothetical protein [Syntrophobacteraceae bacterium]
MDIPPPGMVDHCDAKAPRRAGLSGSKRSDRAEAGAVVIYLDYSLTRRVVPR